MSVKGTFALLKLIGIFLIMSVLCDLYPFFIIITTNFVLTIERRIEVGTTARDEIRFTECMQLAGTLESKT